MCSDVARLSSSGSGDLFELSNSSRSRTFTISPATSTILTANLDLSVTDNSHTAFGACHVIMRKFYYCEI